MPREAASVMMMSMVLLNGCAPQAAQTLLRTQPEAEGVNCAEGGVAVQAGVDDDGDGTLSDDEVDTTAYVCDGAEDEDTAGENTIVVGDYTISNSLDAAQLDGVVQITGTLTIYGQSMGAIEVEDLERVGGLIVGATGADPTFTPTSLSMPALRTIDQDMTLAYLSMTDWSGFDGLETVGGSLTVSNPQSITTLDAFPNLVSVGLGLYLDSADCSLSVLDGFDSLTSVGETISIQGYSSLTRIIGFDSLIYAPELTVSGAALSDLSGFASLTTTTGLLSIEGTVLSDLDDFAALESPAGISLAYMNSLTDLSALSRVSSMPQGIYLEHLSSLDSLSGLASVDSAGSLELWYLESLTDLDDLEGLDVDEAIGLYANSSLTDLSGLSSTTGPLTRLDIRQNPLLSDLDGLNRITSVGSLVESSEVGLVIYSNPLLTDISGLHGVRAIGYGYHEISYNTSLCDTAVAAFIQLVGESNIRSVVNGSNGDC